MSVINKTKREKITKKATGLKTPAILVHPSSMSSLTLFNPNLWKDTSKQIVSSCAAQYGLLCYSSNVLSELFGNAGKLCQPNFQDLGDHWGEATWSLQDCVYFVEIPEVHLYMQGFLGSTKTFLDLIVQLVSEERVVSSKIHGFHTKNNIIGGGILNTLRNNSKTLKKDIANEIISLVEKHKKDWIDEVVKIRDSLTHPEKGMVQVMFELQIQETTRGLKLTRIIKPKISTSKMDFDKYATSVLKKIEIFSEEFLKLMNTIQ